MINHSISDLFDVKSHNPSYFAVKDSSLFDGKLLDFCIPVNLHFPPLELAQLIREHLDEILRYYPDYASVHQQHIGEITGLSPETLVPVNGSTEIITRLCQQAKGPILTSIPTFSRWTDLPQELRVPLHTIVRCREKQFRLGVDEIIDRVREVQARTLVICNPNNPTGAWLTLDEVRTLTQTLADLDTVIIDESFIDFSDLPGVSSVAGYVNETPNLIVVKSLGKSFGWHGVRLGYAVAEKSQAESLRAQLPFWNINGLAAFVLKSVTQFKKEFQASFALVARDKHYMATQLATVPGLTIYPSQANFLFVELSEGVSGRKLRDRLLSNYGLMVRECSNKIGATQRQLRLAVQKKHAVDILVGALQKGWSL